MKTIIISTTTAFSVFLSACGGGGSNGGGSAGSSTATGSSPNSSTTKSATISLLPPAGASAASFTATGDVISDSLAFTNAMRAQIGLAQLKYVPAVAQAAANHALNAQATNIVGHYEVAGQPDYTGVTPSDRVKAAGYTTNSVGEIAAGFPGAIASSTEPIDGLFDAPFHRAIFLFDTTGVGFGQATSTDTSKYSTFVGDFVDYVASTPDEKLIAYPYDGQRNVKPQWQAIETPNPIAVNHPGKVGQYVGYPITLSASGNGAFSNVAFTILDATGNQVPCDETDSSNNVEATRLAMCVPPNVLDDDTTYKVTVTGSLTNTSIATTPFSVTWSFTTGTATGGSNTSATPTAAASAKSQRSEGRAGFTRSLILN